MLDRPAPTEVRIDRPSKRASTVAVWIARDFAVFGGGVRDMDFFLPAISPSPLSDFIIQKMQPRRRLQSHSRR
jgi:hypothetical protein